MLERLRNINWKFFLNNKGVLPWLIPAAISLGSAIYGGLKGKDEPQYQEPRAPRFTPYPTYGGHEDLIKKLYGYMGERMEQPLGMPEDVSQAIWGRARGRAIPGIREAYATRGRARGGQAIQAEATAEREMAIDRAIAEAEWARQAGTQRFGEMMQMSQLYPQQAMTTGQYQQQQPSPMPGYLQQMGAALPYMMGGQQQTQPLTQPWQQQQPITGSGQGGFERYGLGEYQPLSYEWGRG